MSSDLTTWCGTEAQNWAWEQLHRARDLVAGCRELEGAGRPAGRDGWDATPEAIEEAWRNVLVAEGSDWFWWFGEHHHTELDAVWDSDFRLRLQEVYRLLGECVPESLLLPLLETPAPLVSSAPAGPIYPHIDGVIAPPAEWEAAGRLRAVPNPAMQPSATVQVREVRFGWRAEEFCLLVSLDSTSLREGLWIELEAGPVSGGSPLMRVTLQDGGTARVDRLREDVPSDSVLVAWKDVVELSVASTPLQTADCEPPCLLVRVGSDRMAPLEFRG